MIAAMKQISLCFDLEVTEERESKEVKTANGTNDHQEDDQAPFHSPAKATAADLIAQLAFVFQPSTLLFGPFICWPQFEQIRRDAKQHWRRPKVHGISSALFANFFHSSSHFRICWSTGCC
jgi:hypothetical protein